MNHPVHNDYNDISIRLLPKGISFSVREKTGKELFCDRVESATLNGADAISETVLSSGILEKPYNRVNVIVPTPLFGLYPEEVFDSEEADAYFRTITGEVEGKRLLFRHLKELRLFLLFALEERVYDFLIRSFIHPEIEHHLSSLLVDMNAQPSSKSGNVLYVSYDTQLLSVILFKEGRFFSANAYRCGTVNDALYYVLSVWKQFRYDQLNDKLYVIGEGVFSEELFREASRYVQQSAILLANKEML